MKRLAVMITAILGSIVVAIALGCMAYCGLIILKDAYIVPDLSLYYVCCHLDTYILNTPFALMMILPIPYSIGYITYTQIKERKGK